MNNPYLLIVVEKPQLYGKHGESTQSSLDWNEFVSARAKIAKRVPHPENLPENFVLLPLPQALRTASELLHSAFLRELDHTLLYLEAPPVVCE